MSGRTLYCLGEAWLELESPASRSSAEVFRPRGGGSAAVLALAYAARGGRAALLGQLGEDAFGHRIADALADAGVDVCRLCFTSRAPTPLIVPFCWKASHGFFASKERKMVGAI